LNATNAEVKEAFELMIKGGIPDPGDFTYSVPRYNTQLQVLYWLACQNNFKRDDTLALHVAMSNGLWLTIGDQYVRDDVRKYASDLLAFFTEANEPQKRRGQYLLEGYRLEAKMALTWTAKRALRDGPQGFQSLAANQQAKYSSLTENISRSTTPTPTRSHIKPNLVRKHAQLCNTA
jgi:hypothetical protein